MALRDYIALFGLALLVPCAVLVLVGWRNPRSRFLVGMVQTRSRRNRDRPDPARDAAAMCWLLFAFGFGGLGMLAGWTPGERLREATEGTHSYVAAIFAVVCLAVASWIRWGDAPQSLRPAAMRDPV